MSLFLIPLLLSLVGIIAIFAFILAQRPRVTIDDGNHIKLYITMWALLAIGLISGGLMVWDLYGK